MRVNNHTGGLKAFVLYSILSKSNNFQKPNNCVNQLELNFCQSSTSKTQGQESH